MPRRVAAFVGWLLIALLSWPVDTGAAEAHDPAAMRQVVERALPYLYQHGDAWIQERQCTSCHQVPSMLWSLHAAEQASIEVDQASLAQWDDWSWSFCLTHEAPSGKLDGGGTSTVPFMILGRDRSNLREPMASGAGKLGQWLVEQQRDDGSWKPDGQLPAQKRPLPETTQVMTGWSLLALQSLDPREASPSAAVERAKGFLAGEQVGVSNEWHAVRLLLALEAGDETATQPFLAGVESLQHDDGGWGWLTDQPSDALATGQMLYALGAAGLDPDSAVVDRAWQFLAGTQQDDGSWLVNGTKGDSADAPQPTAIYWGTAWAVIGVCETLPPSITP